MLVVQQCKQLQRTNLESPNTSQLGHTAENQFIFLLDQPVTTDSGMGP